MALKDGTNGADYINRRARTLARIYRQAYDFLYNELRKAAPALGNRERALLMIATVDNTIARLDEATKTQLEADIPLVYRTFSDEAKKEIKKLGVAVDPRFSQIHVEAAQAIADDAYLRFARTMQGIKTSAQDFIALAQKETIRSTIAEGQLLGRAAEDVAETVEKQIREQGITALVDRGGKKWELDTYADMLTRQMLANASREGTANTALEYGFDLVRVTSHNSKHDECAVWEGKILSITGKTKGYPTLADAQAAGLFHVGCLHGYYVVAPGLTD